MLNGNYKRISSLLKRPFCFLIILFSVYFDQALAYDSDAGAGGLANVIMEPVGLFSNFMNAGCLILGTSFIFASIVKYFEHRRSPLMVPISTVVFLIVAGFLLLLIPIFSYFYTKSFGISL